MSLDAPAKNKMMKAAPAKKGFHFAQTDTHFAEYIEAETIREAEVIYHKTKRPISPSVSTVPESEEGSGVK
jgi:hypothetical protein